MYFKVGEYCEIKGQVIDVVNPLGVALKHAVYFPYTHSSKWYDPQAIWIPWTQDYNSGLDVRIGDLVDVKGFVVGEHKTGFFADCKYLISDYRSYLRKAGKGEGFTLIFLDPPYATDAVGDALLRIVAAKLAKPGCLVVCESGSPDLLSKIPSIADQFDVLKEARYGITHITLLRFRGEDGEEGEKQ